MIEIRPGTISALALALDLMIRDISESSYAAQWMQHVEYDLWGLVKSGELLGHGYYVDQEQLDTLAELSRLMNGWCDINGFVPMAEWEQRYAEHVASWSHGHEADATDGGAEGRRDGVARRETYKQPTAEHAKKIDGVCGRAVAPEGALGGFCTCEKCPCQFTPDQCGVDGMICQCCRPTEARPDA